MLVQIIIQNFGSSGEGVGRWDGRPVFVEGALPGERVEVELLVEKKTYAKGRIHRLLEPSPLRREAPCPVYERCGGCQLQHLSYEGQLASKTQKVRDALVRIGGFEDASIDPCQPSPNEWAYRNKIQLPVKGTRGALEIGLYARRSHDLVPIDACPIHCSLGEEVYRVVREELLKSAVGPFPELKHVLIRSGVRTGEVLVVWVWGQTKPTAALSELSERLMQRCPAIKGMILNVNPKQDNVILGREWQTLMGRDFIWEELSGLRFKVSPASFFQVNPLQAEKLYAQALAFMEPLKQKTVLDAFCGVGTLSCFLAREAGKVIGVEVVPQAIEDAKANAALNGLENTDFLCGATETLLPSLPEVDAVLLNPPRKGCERAVLDSLIERRVPQVVYVSCDPATLARDLRVLVEGGYTLGPVAPFDMFPETAHVETVVQLQFSPKP